MSAPFASPPRLPEHARGERNGAERNGAETGRATTRMQRLAILAALLVGGWVSLQLFASVLLPFVAAAGTAYFLDPPARRLTRAGVPRGVAALLMIVALLAVALVFALLLYPLILAQIGILITRLPDYVGAIRGFATEVIAHLQERLGPEFVDAKLRDLVAGQAGTMLSVLVTAISRLIGGSFALFNVATLLLVTPVVAFYLLRDWPGLVARIDGWLPRRYAGVLRAQAREVDRILSAWLRGQAFCCIAAGAVLCRRAVAGGARSRPDRRAVGGGAVVHPVCGQHHRGGDLDRPGAGAVSHLDEVLIVVGVFVAGQTLEGYVIYPRFLGDRVELHAVWVIFALFAGGAAFGFLGVLLAVPMAAVIGVLCRFWLHRYLQSPLYLELPSHQEGEP